MFAGVLLSVLGLAPVLPGTLTVDAFFDDWSEEPVWQLDRTVRGSIAGPSDLVGRIQLAQSGESLFFALQIQDDEFQRGTPTLGDAAEILFKGPAGTARFLVVLNQLEGTPAEVFRGGKPYKAARIASTTRKDGWAVELSLPVSVFPGLKEGDVGLAVTVRDADHDPSMEAVLSTGPIGRDGLPEFPNVRLDVALGMYGLYQGERGTTMAELSRTRGNVAGDENPEEIVVNDLDLVVAGRGLPEGATFFYFTHGWGAGATLKRLDLQELDGRPGKEILVERVEHAPDVDTEILEIYGVQDGLLKRMFAQKLAEVFPSRGAEVRARFKVLPGAGRGRNGPARFEVTRGVAKNVTEFDYPPELPGVRGYQPLRLPWSAEAGSAFYGLEGEFWQSQGR